jgi:hypothetical protein
MPMLTLRYDMRSPEIGAPASHLYRAAIEQCAWAEEHLGAWCSPRPSAVLPATC